MNNIDREPPHKKGLGSGHRPDVQSQTPGPGEDKTTEAAFDSFRKLTVNLRLTNQIADSKTCSYLPRAVGRKSC